VLLKPPDLLRLFAHHDSDQPSTPEVAWMSIVLCVLG
jgi:hypothetical protein